MKKVIIVHGYGGNPDENWFPWLKAQLESSGVAVEVPNMPNTDTPTLSAWLPYLQQVAGQVDEDTYLVGHSLGCPTILRFLESLEDGAQVGGVVLVAGFAEPIHLSELDNFTVPPWKDERIKQAAKEILLINSDNDPHIPLEMAERMHERFDAELVVMHNAQHINERAGFTEVPIIFDKLARMLGIEDPSSVS